ncbi:MAG: NAD-dependent epimerase/dehydratase family protein [Candidatus Aminicenantes bacterium]|nr:NAD-dependent epimerase/dehydratase family protein [Candidatus Aminicenantes bacterium]
MKAIVTGAAGFIGSHLARRLVADGHEVVGVDCFTPYYPRWMKLRNLASLKGNRRFRLVEKDLNDLALGRLLSGAEAVFHLAAQAGVRASWGRSFQSYLRHNIAATQRLLETVKMKGGPKVVYASSSSVYGATPDLPMKETSPLRPLSPYGVTKLAAEDLCFLYHKNYGLPAVSLRFFTVYGPGQRPDMAFHKFFKAVLDGTEVTVYGDGRQTRDFTYVDDIVEAVLAAAERGREGEVYNIGGGHRERLDGLFPLIESIAGQRLRLRRVERQKGDAPDTHAAIDKAGRDLDFKPRTSLRDGLAAEWEDIQSLYRRPRRPPGP